MCHVNTWILIENPGAEPHLHWLQVQCLLNGKEGKERRRRIKQVLT